MAGETAKSITSKRSKAAAQASAGTNANSLLKSSAAPVSADARRVMIAEAAYYLAQRRGFAGGNEVEDWLLAERQIDAALSAEASPQRE